MFALNPGRLIFVQWRLMFLGSPCAVCFMSVLENLECRDDFWIFKKSVHPCFNVRLALFYYNLSDREEWLRPREEYCLLGHGTCCETKIYECFGITSSSISRWRCYVEKEGCILLLLLLLLSSSSSSSLLLLKFLRRNFMLLLRKSL